MRKPPIVSALAAGALVAGALAALPASAQASASPRVVPDAAPSWTASAHALGAASAGAHVSARVYLTPRGGFAALRSAAASASAHRTFLSAAQYHAAYDPSSSTVSSVRTWLRSSGLRVAKVEAHHRYLAVTGTVAQANKAFATTILRYRHSGHTVQAPSSAVRVPAAVAASVLTVTGLDTTPAVVHPASTQAAPPPDGFYNARPCSKYYGQILARKQADYTTPLPAFKGKYLPYAVCGYTGTQYRGAYENNSHLSGTGITVAITDAYASPTMAADAAQYASLHGDAPYAAGQYTEARPTAKFHDGATCDPGGWYGEETLDVEAVHAMAQGAKIRYYPSPACFDADFQDTLANVVDEDKAQLVSNSWGGLELSTRASAVRAYETIFLQGALEGISFMFSSGDNGDEVTTGIRQVDYPTSDPYVTAVGGTSSAIVRGRTFGFQTGWGTRRGSLAADGSHWNEPAYQYGAGGGQSALFNQPDYQAGVTPGPGRDVPDVAMDADPTTGMLIGETQTFPGGVKYGEYRIGGTSLASPLFAGMTALAFQRGARTGAGLLNPTIYANATSGVFTDVAAAPTDAGNVRVDYVNGLDPSDGLSYTVRTFNQNSGLTTGPGWDDTTGVGAPNSGWLGAFTS